MTATAAIGILTTEKHRYCRQLLIQFLKALTFPDKKFIFVTKEKDDVKDLEEKTQPLENVTILTGDLKVLRKAALDAGADFLFIVQGTVMGPKNIIEALARHNKPAVGGVYLDAFKDTEGKTQIAPFARVFDTPGKTKHLHIAETIRPRLLPVAKFGFGCCLIRKTLLEKYQLDDSFFTQAEKDGVELYLDTLVKCMNVKFPVNDERNKPFDARNYSIKVKAKLAEKK